MHAGGGGVAHFGVYGLLHSLCHPFMIAICLQIGIGMFQHLVLVLPALLCAITV